MHPQETHGAKPFLRLGNRPRAEEPLGSVIGDGVVPFGPQRRNGGSRQERRCAPRARRECGAAAPRADCRYRLGPFLGHQRWMTWAASWRPSPPPGAKVMPVSRNAAEMTKALSVTSMARLSFPISGPAPAATPSCRKPVPAIARKWTEKTARPNPTVPSRMLRPSPFAIGQPHRRNRKRDGCHQRKRRSPSGV